MPPQIRTVVAAFLAAVPITDQPTSAITWLERLSEANGWAPAGSTSREWAENKAENFLHALRREHEGLAELGRVCPFRFNSSSPYLVQGASFIEPSDDEETKEAKRRHSRVSDYVAAMQELQPAEFEALCVGVLDVLGIHDAKLTPKSGDEGIDFYGRWPVGTAFGGDVFPTIRRQLGVWMVGQAKHYQVGKVSTPSIRELVGSIELAKSGTFAGSTDRYADLIIRICDPIFYLFFTTGRISRDRWRLSQRSGVVAMDGEMLATFLAENEIGVVDGRFDSGRFSEWVAEFCGRRTPP